MREYALIMAGGIGKRLEPLSTPQRPKQFLELYGGATLLQQTARRLRPLFTPEQTLVATSAEHRALVAEQLPDLPEERLILEAARKNTAPCIALATWVIAQSAPDAVIGTFPADHFIGDDPAFQTAVRRAMHVAASHQMLVTIGITPTEPATEYGYIKCGPELDPGPVTSYRVERFTEKPDLARAKEYVQSQDYLWNSGMFAWRADTLLAEMAVHLPNVSALLKEVRLTRGRLDSESLNTFFSAAPRISVDYGILERSKKVAVVKSACGWSDLGSFDAIRHLAELGRVHLSAATQDAVNAAAGTRS